MRRLLYLAPLLLLITSAASSLWPARAAADFTSNNDFAGATFTFADRSDITADFGSAGKVTFTDGDITDSHWNYTPDKSSGLCDPGTVSDQGGVDGGIRYGINLSKAPSGAASISATFKVGFTIGTAGNCQLGALEKITIDNPDSAALADLKWDGNNIASISDKTTYSPAINVPAQTLYQSSTKTGCSNALLYLDPGDPNHAEAYLVLDPIGRLQANGDDSQFANLHVAKNCHISDLGNQLILGSPGTSTDTTASTGASTTGGGNKQLGCDYNGNPLSWVICPIVTMMAEFVGKADNVITNQLEVKTNTIFCGKNSSANDPCRAYYTAWQSFRNIALGLMVIGGLVMLIAQALGAEILDAYTLRKVLPRLLIAAVGITVSLPLMQFMVTLSNDLGIGIRHLIYDPFINLHNSISINLGGNIQFLVGGIGAVAGVTVTAVWLVFGGAGIILAMLGTAALAIVVALLVLILRQVAITLLIILAPIAIVCYILPNTQKTYHIWWDSFSKALLMFPLIAGLIASGRVFSAIANSQATQGGGGPEGLIWGFAAFAAYFAPYFLIPATFKLAGGAIRNIGGFVNDRGRGGFDRLRNYRQQRGKKGREDFTHKAHTGGFGNVVPARFNRLNRMGRGVSGAMNVASRHATSGIRGGYGFGARGQTAAEAHLMAGKEAALKEEAFQKNATSNGFMRLMTLTAKHHGNEAEAVKELRGWYSSDKNEYNRKFEGKDLEDKIADAQARMRNVGGYNSGRAAAAFVAMGADGTAIRNVEDMGNIASWVSEGSTSSAYNLMSEVGSVSKQRGRSSLSPSQDNRGALADAVVKKHKGEIVPNYDKVLDAATMSGAGGDTGLSVLSGSPSREVRGRVDDAMRMLEKYEADPGSVDFSAAAQAASVVLDLKNNVDIGYGTTDNKKAYQDAMDIGDRRELLNKFLSSPQPGAPAQTVRAEGPVEATPPTAGGVVMPKPPPTAQITPTTFDYVKTLVGEKYSSMPQDQLAALQDQARQQRDQQQQQGQQQP